MKITTRIHECQIVKDVGCETYCELKSVKQRSGKNRGMLPTSPRAVNKRNKNTAGNILYLRYESNNCPIVVRSENELARSGADGDLTNPEIITDHRMFTELQQTESKMKDQIVSYTGTSKVPPTQTGNALICNEWELSKCTVYTEILLLRRYKNFKLICSTQKKKKNY